MGEHAQSEITVEAAEEYLREARTYDPPPPDFDPFRANERELAVYGFPRRPDPETEPRLVELWERAFAYRHKVVRARLRVSKPLLDWRQSGFGTSGWGGVVAEPGNYGVSEPANVVYAEWTMPTIDVDPQHPSTPMGVAFWVGLDGYIISHQVVQAGVAAAVNIGGPSPARYEAWFEWFPAPPVAIAPQTFPIYQGDRVSVLVCTPRPDRGFVSMHNKTRGVITNVGFPPPGVASDGTSAEWVVETMTAWSDELPDFGAVVFLDATAGTKNHVLDLSKATTTEIGGSSGNDLTSSSVHGRDRAVVIWERFS